MSVYHPDPAIDAEVAADALAAETADLAAGYAPRRWRCVCGAEHSRGHFGTIGLHRCLACGYVGTGGVMLDERSTPAMADGNDPGHPLVPDPTRLAWPQGGPPAPGHRTLNVILRDAIRAAQHGSSRPGGGQAALAGLRAEYDAASGALFEMLTGQP